MGGELGRPHPAVDLELVGPLGVGVRLGDRPQFARGERLAENYGRAGHGLSGQDDVLRGDIDVIAGRRGRAGEVERDRDRRLRRRVSADDRVARGATREELRASSGSRPSRQCLRFAMVRNMVGNLSHLSSGIYGGMHSGFDNVQGVPPEQRCVAKTSLYRRYPRKKNR